MKKKIFGTLAVILFVFATAETPEKWDFSYFLMYRFGTVLLMGICLFESGIFSKNKNDE